LNSKSQKQLIENCIETENYAKSNGGGKERTRTLKDFYGFSLLQ